MSVLRSMVPLFSAFSSILAHLVSCTTSSSRNSSTGKVKPGMWIIGHLSAGGWRSQILSRISFPARVAANFCCIAHQNTWRTSLRWEWRSWEWLWGHLDGWAGPSRWWATRPTAGFSREFRPAPGDWCWTGACRTTIKILLKKCWFQIRWCDEFPIWCVRCLEYCISLKIEVSPSL